MSEALIQDGVRRIVEEIFPDAPERCLNCPGLWRAANVLIMNASMLSGAGIDPNNPDNPLADLETVSTPKARAMGDALRVTTEVADQEIEFVRQTAKELWERCDYGAGIIMKSRESLLRTRVATISCRSRLPLNVFVVPYRIRPPMLQRKFMDVTPTGE